MAMEGRAAEVAASREQYYRQYMEAYPRDSEIIRAGYARVEALIGKLPQEKADAVCEEVGALCAEHERRGFEAGFRAAMEQIRA